MAILLVGQERGLIRMRHSPRTIAQMIQAVTLGRIIAEIEGEGSPESRQSWIVLVNDLLDAMVFDGLIDE